MCAQDADYFYFYLYFFSHKYCDSRFTELSSKA